MDERRLRALLQLSRLGSMAEAAAELGTTTSNISQTIAALSREVGAPLVEPVGRRVRLTPAGRRLADHAVAILAAVEAARLDFDLTAEPRGVVRVAGFATAIRRSLLPVMDDLAHAHPGLDIRLREHEPPEALALLDADEVDVALAYDYNLAPAAWPTDYERLALWEVEWGLGAPTGQRLAQLQAYAGHDWIVNSRHTADETVLRTLSSMAGFTPRVVHRVDALELVDDLILAGRGVALLPLDRTPRRGVRVRRLTGARPMLRTFAVTRTGRGQWPPLKALLDRLAA